MAYEQHAAEWLRQMPEIRLLGAISDSLGIPIRIHGGVARNLLARAIAADEGAETTAPVLSDLVDPFSDIDLVVPRRADFDTVLSAVFARIGLAPVFRWELKTAAQIDYLRRAGATTSLDSIEIHITKHGAHLEHVEPAAMDLRNRVLTGRVPEAWRVRRDPELFVDVAIQTLRAARFAAQFDLSIDERLEQSLRQTNQEMVAGQRRESPYIALAIMDLLFTASTTIEARRRLGWTRETVPLLARRYDGLFGLAYAALERDVMHAVVYPASEASRLRVDFRPDRPRETDWTDGHSSRVPWTPITLPKSLPCCPIGDFSLGSLVIAWRGIQVPDAFQLGTVVLAPSADPYNEASSPVFGVPGIVDSGRSVVMRMDWAFAALLAGPRRTVFVGAREALD